MYRALVGFTDLKDNKHRYAAGDVYPREGYTPDSERINELLSGENKRGIPVIEQTAEPENESPIISKNETAEKPAKRKNRKPKSDE